MRKNIVKILLSVMFISILSDVSVAEFTPWNADTFTGDALIETFPADRAGGVYNGAQAGAFFLLRFFQVFISPQDGANCRHIPTCSSYARQAVVIHGALLGSILAGDRLLRCNPFYPPSKDPVPENPFAK